MGEARGVSRGGGWTEAQKRAYVLADNQLAITGSGWDPELLRLGAAHGNGRGQ